MLHSELLWGGDRWVNMVEAISLLGCLIAVSLIAKGLGAGAWGQILAAVVCVAIPEGLLEASGPMNTYVVSFWMAVTLAFLLSANEAAGWLDVVCAGLATGLAVFTKGTAYIYLPFLMIACWWMGSGAARVRILKRVPVILALMIGINAAQYVRCYQLTGTPLGLPLPV